MTAITIDNYITAKRKFDDVLDRFIYLDRKSPKSEEARNAEKELEEATAALVLQDPYFHKRPRGE